jgi:hypothetical protein
MADPPAHTVRVWPWLRRPGKILLRDWLAITLGGQILAWRALTDGELAHELEHVRQWRRHGPIFPIRYLMAGWAARRAGGHWYRDNPFEMEARAAARRAGRAGD